jgi:hypothetical protein
MKRLWIIAAALASLLAIQIAWADMHGKMPAPGGEELWSYIAETHDYKEWSSFPGWEGMYEGKSPHGAYLKLYANDIAVKAAEQGMPLPDRAILVKENYAEDRETLAAVTPMYKVEGYNPEAGDWFWAKYGPDGKIMAEGKVDGCIKCHSVKKNQDYIFSQPR